MSSLLEDRRLVGAEAERLAREADSHWVVSEVAAAVAVDLCSSLVLRPDLCLQRAKNQLVALAPLSRNHSNFELLRKRSLYPRIRKSRSLWADQYLGRKRV